jgi:hypothetical protein
MLFNLIKSGYHSKFGTAKFSKLFFIKNQRLNRGIIMLLWLISFYKIFISNANVYYLLVFFKFFFT